MDWKERWISEQRVARLATISAAGRLQIVPIVYAYDGEQFFTPLDEKPKRVEAYALQRVRNVQANPQVALIIDHYAEDWTQLRWVQVRGKAEIIAAGSMHASGVSLLHQKYGQYATMPLYERPLILIKPLHIAGWRATES